MTIDFPTFVEILDCLELTVRHSFIYELYVLSWEHLPHFDYFTICLHLSGTKYLENNVCLIRGKEKAGRFYRVVTRKSITLNFRSMMCQALT